MWLFGSLLVGQRSPPTNGISLCVTIGELVVPMKSFDHSVVLKIPSRALCMLSKYFTKWRASLVLCGCCLSSSCLCLPRKITAVHLPWLEQVWCSHGRGIWRLTGYILPRAFHRKILSILKMSYSLGKRRDNSPLLLLKGKFLKLSNSHQWETFTLLWMCLTTFTRVHPSNQTLAATHKDASMLPKNPSPALISYIQVSLICFLFF